MIERGVMADELVRDLVTRIVAPLPEGSRLTLRDVAAAPRVQRRVAGAERSEQLIADARETRTEDGTPFWHALFSLGQDQPSGVPIEIVRSALFHQDPVDDPAVVLEVDDRIAERVADLASTVAERHSLTIDSQVMLPDGSLMFIPMLDFSVKSGKVGGDATARSCVTAIGHPGLLVASGRSFHFYGRHLLSASDQIRFWARALLLTPMVDERWIAHQMLGGRAALRVSANEKGEVPAVVWDFHALPA